MEKEIVTCSWCNKVKQGTPQGLCSHCGRFGKIPTELIVWDPIKDHHRKGKTSRGDIWIRYDREEKPTAIYTKFDEETEKFPTEAWLGIEETTDEKAMELAQNLFENLKKAEEIANRKIV